MNTKAVLIGIALWLFVFGSGLARPLEQQAPDPKSEYLRTREAMIQIGDAVRKYSIDFGYVPQVSSAVGLCARLLASLGAAKG